MQKKTLRLYHENLPTAVGPLTIVADEEYLHAIHFDTEAAPHREPGIKARPLVIQEAIDQLSAYFERKLRLFDLPLKLSGTPFQLSVWDEMQRIEFGTVRTYKEMAERLGNQHLARAVGGAANRNPIPIIVPCHRVVGSSGWLGGFAPGVAYKRILLGIEGSLPGS